MSNTDHNDVTIDCDVLSETGNAYKVLVGRTEHWIPKSQVLGENISKIPEEGVQISIPEWLAIKEGLA